MSRFLEEIVRLGDGAIAGKSSLWLPLVKGQKAFANAVAIFL
jgi:hypothetical protein